MNFMGKPLLAGTFAAALGILMAYAMSETAGISSPRVTLWIGIALALAFGYGFAWVFFRKR